MDDSERDGPAVPPSVMEAGLDLIAEYFGDLGVSKAHEQAFLTTFYRLALCSEPHGDCLPEA
jgi:hypothetical protein